MIENITFVALSVLGLGIGLLYGQAIVQRERADRYRQWNDILCQQYRSLEEAYSEQARILREMIEDGDATVDATNEPVEWPWLN